MRLSGRSVSVVIPSYNEKDNIAEAIGRIEAAVGKQLLEIVIVDDNSPDGTWKIVEELKNPCVHLIRRVNEKGLASALARGTSAAKGDAVVWLDCDLGIPPEMIPRLVEALQDHDIAIGSRYVDGGGDNRHWFRAFLSWLFNFWARLLLGGKVRDYTSGFAAVRHKVLANTPLLPNGFGEYFIDWSYRSVKAGYRIVEIPYPYGYRKTGLSKTDSDWVQFCRLGMQYTRHLIKTPFVYGYNVVRNAKQKART